jgi:hypothetical protein
LNTINQLSRDEDSVSAAVATVLLFGGVLSIIGLMMVSMIPVIEELEGSVERHDMSAQMALLAHKTALLSETGMPGDSTSAELIPVDGNLVWDRLRGGMWYSATWGEDMSLRARSVVDFDDEFEIRHPETETSVVCTSDLRLGINRPFYYDIPPYADQFLLTAKPGLALPLGPIEVSLTGDNGYEYSTELLVDEVFSAQYLNSVTNLTVESTHELNILALAGSDGATYIPPNQPDAASKMGRSWSIPLPVGKSTVYVTSTEANQVTMMIGDDTSIYYGLPDNIARTGTAVQIDFNQSQSEVVHLFSSSDSQVVFRYGSPTSEGLTYLPSTSGPYFGQQFIPPQTNSTIRLANPGQTSLTVAWRGGGITVAAQDFEEVSWPPSTTYSNPLILESDTPFSLLWSSYDASNSVDTRSGMLQLIAEDTGFWTGSHFNYTSSTDLNQNLEASLRGYRSQFQWQQGAGNGSSIFIQDGTSMKEFQLGSESLDIQVNNTHPLSVLRQSGNSGALFIPHSGVERCQSVGTLASGWMPLQLPWEGMGGRSDTDVENAWIDGRHPSSVQIDVFGTMGQDFNANIGTVWAFHLSRLSYQFKTSVRGMEVAYSGGAVMTNHPEFNPYIVIPPSDRGGPGPRFAATIPALHPTSDSVIGGGKLSIDVELNLRTSLASTDAYEIRRGWNEPYGKAIAEHAGEGLGGSEDWTVYPGRLDLLTDYVGWVPDPSFGTSETVWHTNGEVIKFSLQLSALEVTLREANR